MLMHFNFFNKLGFTLCIASLGATHLADQAVAPKPEVQALIDAGLSPKMDPSDSLSKFQEAEQVAIRLKDLVGQDQALGWEGRRLVQLGKNDAAITCLSEALSIANRVNDKLGQGAALNNLGNAYVNQGQFDKAREVDEKSLRIRREIGDKVGEGNSLNSLGVVFSRIGRNEDALDYFSQALIVKGDNTDREGEASVYNNIAQAYYSLHQLQKTRDSYAKALAIQEELADEGGQAHTLRQLAGVSLELGDSESAANFSGKALALYEKLGDRPKIGQTLEDLGNSCFDLGQTQTGMSYFEKALREAGSDPESQHRLLSAIGRGYSRLGESQKAIAYFERALPIAKENHNKEGEAETLTELARLDCEIGESQNALEHGQRALELEKQAGDKKDEPSTLTILGLANETVGNASEALDKFQAALSMSRELGDKSVESSSLRSLGNFHERRGDSDKALECFNQSLRLDKQSGDLPSEASTLSSMGSAYSTLGDEQRALDLYNAALQIQVESADRRGEAKTLNRIGNVLTQFGQKQMALSDYEKVIEVDTELGDKQGVADALNNMGPIYAALGEHNKAIDCYTKALPLEIQLKSATGQASVLSNMGDFYRASGRPKDALTYYTNAVNLEGQVGDKSHLVISLNSTGLAYSELKDYKTALQYCQKALPVAQSIHNRALEATTLINIGAMYDRLSQPDLAKDQFELALPIVREVAAADDEATLLRNLATREVKTAPRYAVWLQSLCVRKSEWLKAQVPTLKAGERRSYADLLASRYGTLSDLLLLDNRPAECQQVLALAKNDAVSETAPELPQTKQERRWTEGFDHRVETAAKIGVYVSKLRAIKSLSAEQAKELRSSLVAREQAEREIRAFLASVIQESKSVGTSGQSGESTETSREMDVTLAALPAKTCAVYAVPGTDHLNLLVVHSGRSVVKTVAAKGLAAKVKSFLLAIQDPAHDPRPAGKVLYDVLIKPIESELDGNAVSAWSLSGVLRGVPLAALWDGSQFVLEKYPGCRFSPSFLNALTSNPTRGGSALIVGTTTANKVTDPITGVPLTFPALPGVRGETSAVSSALSAPPLLDGEFSRDSLVNSLASKPSVLHVASHFRYVPGDDRRSFLLTGDGGAWTVEDIKALPDNGLEFLDLVTLSACGTSSGESAKGDEAESFAAWMQRKGAKAVVSTLWPIADQSTALLMGEFYRLMKSHPDWTKLQALRQAQISMFRGELVSGGAATRRAEEATMAAPAAIVGGVAVWPKELPRFSHPYFWAPFVLTGNWK
jgi:tetratricopeptide (TPR) repeat protein/CHAT domain-containing protein